MVKKVKKFPNLKGFDTFDFHEIIISYLYFRSKLEVFKFRNFFFRIIIIPAACEMR